MITKVVNVVLVRWLLLLPVCFSLQIELAGAEGSPNFVLILTDDQGWNNTEVPMIQDRADTRSDYYLTPNMLRLAKSGMTFSQAYAPHPVCSPSRHAIQFGMSPAKLKKTTNRGVNYREFVESPSIPQLLKAAFPEYKAAHYGKWHMYAHPAERGYDASDGRTGNQTGRQKTTDQTKFWAHEDPKRAVSITDDAVQFIKHQSATGAPFFLQVSHYFIHLSAEAKSETLKKHQSRPPGDVHTAYWYAAMMDDLDHALGRVMDTVEELGLSDNTYVIFTSDNGGTARQFPDFNKPLRAGKGSYYEGGIRVPFFIAGPGIESGSYATTPIVGYDLLPTILELSGSTLPVPSEVEGGSFADILLNRGNGRVSRPRNGIYFSRQVNAVLIQDSWKLIRTHRSGKLELFDLSTDLSEMHDLAELNSKKANEMNQDLTDWIEEIDALTPSPYASRPRNN